MTEPGPYDALLVLSFGGPEGPQDVRPFLANVTRGRDIPPERLDAVAQHYLHFGGVSPITALNRQLIGQVQRELRNQHRELPVFFGNRNWHPLVADTLAEMQTAGVRRALVFATSAWGGYSGCRQYQDDIAGARAAVGPQAPELVRLRQFFDHPLFIDTMADAITAGFAKLPEAQRRRARLVFTAHSVPESADVASGLPEEGGRRYSRQVAQASRLAAGAAGIDEFDLAWQSRSGPPSVPWLFPDIAEHLRLLHTEGVPAVVVCPIGFVADHLEVVWDLDNEAAAAADELGITFVRTATAGADPRLAQLVVELVAEQVDGLPARRLSSVPAGGCTRNGAPCALRCCEPVLRPR